MGATYVVKKAYEEFTYKKSVLLVPGFKNKLLVQAVRFMPRWVTRKIIKKVNKG
jgi:short-subunit dehydrogenase